MNIYRALFIAALTFKATVVARSAEIQLEHTFIGGDGSSWGTDDSLRRALALPEACLPRLYKLPARRARPLIDTSARGRFAYDHAVLFDRLLICHSSRVEIFDAAMKDAVRSFFENVSGHGATQIRVEIRSVNTSHLTSLAACDVIVERGAWSRFPYRYLPDQDAAAPSYLGKVYALFYRQASDRIPVITLHPDLTLSTSTPDGVYLSPEATGWQIDAKTLVLHELGHVLGFDHIDPQGAFFDHPEATLMGLKNGQRPLEALKLRFSVARDLWRYLDSNQTSIYRRLLEREFHPGCPLPNKNFRPLPGRPLATALAEFNARLETEKPWGHYPLSQSTVREFIQKKMWEVTPSNCIVVQSVLEGVMPLDFNFDFESGKRTEGCADSAGCRYFRVRLEHAAGATHFTPLEVGPEVSASAGAPHESNFEYACMQPEDTFYANIPAVKFDGQLKDSELLFEGDPLFTFFPGTPDVFTFDINSRITLKIAGDDYEDEVRFHRVRLLQSEDKIYTWIGMRGTEEEGVVHDLRVQILIDGHEAAASQSYSIDFRKNLGDCN